LRRWLEAQGVEAEAASELVVGGNEMAGNAIEHAYGPDDAAFQFRARCHAGTVTMEIRDQGRWREPVAGNRGRGTDIARQLTDDLRVERSDRGTTVRMTRHVGGAG